MTESAVLIAKQELIDYFREKKIIFTTNICVEKLYSFKNKIKL
jgi:hypothetical protein